MTSKYASLLADVYSVFNSSAWKAENIATYPENFTGALETTYIRVTVVPGKIQEANTFHSASGQLLVDIFIPAGGGPSKGAQIADKLDTYLAGKLVATGANGNTQFSSSTLSIIGIDKDNPSLYRMVYTLPFNFFGV